MLGNKITLLTDGTGSVGSHFVAMTLQRFNPEKLINRDVAPTLATDKLLLTGDSCAGNKSTRIAVIRCGDLRGARGSVIPFFQSIRDRGVRPITEPRMTRFMFTPEQAVEPVWAAFEDMEGGRIRLRRTPLLTITDIARSLAPDIRSDVVGNRPGEQRQPQMIGPEDFTPARHSDSHWMRPEDPSDRVERNAARTGAI